MFGMSFGEILVIAIIAILFIGPDKLPDAMVKIAKFFRSFKKSVNEVKESIEQEVHLSELKQEAISYKEQLEKSVDEIKKDTISDVDVMDDLSSGFADIKESLTNLDEGPSDAELFAQIKEEQNSEETEQKKPKKAKKKKGNKKDV
jgi:sec-independent protein translocase protein TatB